MKRMFDFDKYSPPNLCEEDIYERLEKRKKKYRLVMISLGNLLFQAALLLFSYMIYPVLPVCSIVVICYVFVSGAGSGAIAVIYSGKGGVNL